jgi:predicted DNA-binding transcriptional regulator YafY
MKTSRISRIIQILTALQSGQHYTVDDLSKMLGIGRRTVFRDLKDMQRADVPCYYDKKAHGYTISQEFFLAAPGLNVQETLGLLLLVHKARNRILLPFKDSILQAALKIENSVPNKIKGFCNKALMNISMRTSPQVNARLFDKIFVQLIEAILEKRVVKIHFYEPSEHKTLVTELSPYHLLYDEHAWYVLGKSDLYTKVRAFRLSRLEELNKSQKRFVEDETFDVGEYLGRAWAVMPEGRLYNIKLRFLPEVADDVTKVQWHSTQSVIFEKDGSALVEFRVDGLNEITWWILSFGDKVQVLAPEILRQKIIKIAENTAKQNKLSIPAKPRQ